MNKITLALSTVLLLVLLNFSNSAVAQTPSNTPANSSTVTTDTEHHDDHNNWGLAGLLGLLGLIGLRGRDRTVDSTKADYTNRTNPNR